VKDGIRQAGFMAETDGDRRVVGDIQIAKSG